MARKTKENKLELDQEVEIAQDNAVQADEAQPEHDANYRSRCGGALLMARESQGLSIQDIASRLRLGPKQIEALEADNFAALPEPTIVRGFIRNYAKQLKINAEPLLDAYSVLVPSTELHGLTVKPSANMKMTSHKKAKPGRYIWVGLAALIGLGVWLFYQNYVAKPSPAALSTNAIGENIVGENQLSAEPLPEVALPMAEREAALQPSTELTLPAPATPADTSVSNATPTNTDLPATTVLPATAAPEQSAALAQPLAPAASTPTASVPVPAPSGMAKLEFNASQETWISVVDASGREIYNKIIFAGSRDSIDVTPPVNVTVGNAGATNVSMNGKPVELAPYKRGNVARLKLE